jgi:N-acetylneuraminic acid mutarotase
MTAAFIVILAVIAFDNRVSAQGMWTTVAPIQTARDNSAYAVLNDELYVASGQQQPSSCNYTHAVEVYNALTNSWRYVAPLPYTTFGAGGASVNGHFYVIGGTQCPGPSLAAVSIYDPLTDVWTPGSPMNIAKQNFVTAAVNGKIYALGGVSSGTSVADAEVYDPVLDHWTNLPPVPAPRGSVAGAAVGNKIYVISGDYTNTVFEFDTVTNTWSSKSPMPAINSGAEAVVVNGLIYVLGGDAFNCTISGPCDHTSVFVYDPQTDSWSAGVPLPDAVGGFAVANIVDCIYVASGISNGERNEAYQFCVEPAGDTTPPVIHTVTANPNVIWPPNRKMAPVTVNINATDDSGTAMCNISSISSNEPGPGEFQISGNLTANLKADRNAAGTGRTYTITVQCKDPSNNTSSADVHVAVPHDQAK